MRKPGNYLSLILTGLFALPVQARDIPIADVHVHYSHDSVELTPPERVIELMRDANLKFAVVSSSDDKGTQLLLDLAPEMIVPGLRPYRRRGETSSWITDPAALEYVEDLLQRGTYATIGEFHLYGDDAKKQIPQRIVELADQHNLLLHAHSDAEAVEHLLASSEDVRVIWAHAGFDNPADIAPMLRKHDRLWADLAFRSEVGSGGQLSEDWLELFKEFPTRLMLGTDTYTPERIYYIPEHAESARSWLTSLPIELAEQLAWKNAYDLVMPVWQENRQSVTVEADASCIVRSAANEWLISGSSVKAIVRAEKEIKVGEAFAVDIELCESDQVELLEVDATMPSHGHGMNYKAELSPIQSSGVDSSENSGAKNGEGAAAKRYRAEGLLFHMPGEWQWSLKVRVADQPQTLTGKTTVQ